MKVNIGQVYKLIKTESVATKVIDALILELYDEPIHEGKVLTYVNLQNLKLGTVLLNDKLKASFKSGKLTYELKGLSPMKSFPSELALSGGFIENESYVLNTITYNKNKIEFSATPVICIDSEDYAFKTMHSDKEFVHPGGQNCMIGRGEFGINIYYISKH